VKKAKHDGQGRGEAADLRGFSRISDGKWKSENGKREAPLPPLHGPLEARDKKECGSDSWERGCEGSVAQKSAEAIEKEDVRWAHCSWEIFRRRARDTVASLSN